MTTMHVHLNNHFLNKNLKLKYFFYIILFYLFISTQYSKKLIYAGVPVEQRAQKNILNALI